MFPSPDFFPSAFLLLNDSLLLCLTVSVLSSLPPISQKQMRTLRCGLRYTGVASWPRSVHRTVVRCTMKCCSIPSFWLSCCCCCSPSHCHTTQQTDVISDCCCRAAAAAAAASINLQSIHIVLFFICLIFFIGESCSYAQDFIVFKLYFCPFRLIWVKCFSPIMSFLIFSQTVKDKTPPFFFFQTRVGI